MNLKTNWEALSLKMGVLQPNGSELYLGQSKQAIEEILGQNWIEEAVDWFIEGKKGNELAIKTLRYIGSQKAAEYAHNIFTENRTSNVNKANLALWAICEIRHPLCIKYVEECLGHESYEPIALAILRNLIFDYTLSFEAEQLLVLLSKFDPRHQSAIEPLIDFVNQELNPVKWYSLLAKIQKRPALYNIQKVEDILLFQMGYTTLMTNRGVSDADMDDFVGHFSDFVIKDYSAPGHCNWATAIRLFSSSDSGSVELFFEELAKYKSKQSDFDRIKYREDSKIFCCQKMQDELKNISDNTPIIHYDNEHVLKDKSGVGNYSINKTEIKHCPWCGTKLK